MALAVSRPRVRAVRQVPRPRAAVEAAAVKAAGREDTRVVRACRLHERALALRGEGRLREAETACREALALVQAAIGPDAANVMGALAQIQATATFSQTRRALHRDGLRDNSDV